MNEYIAPLEQLIERFRKLPGVGRKSAIRMAFGVLESSDEDTKAFADAIVGLKQAVKLCSCCQNISEGELCSICSDALRDRSTVCVVENVQALMAMERVKEYKGLYHVLHGTISPLDGKGPEQLKTKELLDRVKSGEIKEIIIATNPTVDGETTALYLAKLLKPYDIRVTRLAYGIPVGGELDYADELTLFRAIDGRKDI